MVESKLQAVWDAWQNSLLFDIFLSSLAFQEKKKKEKEIGCLRSSFYFSNIGKRITKFCNTLLPGLCSKALNGIFFLVSVKSPNPWGLHNLVPMNISSFCMFCYSFPFPNIHHLRESRQECSTTTTTTKTQVWMEAKNPALKFALNSERDCCLSLLQLILNSLMMHIQTRWRHHAVRIQMWALYLSDRWERAGKL